MATEYKRTTPEEALKKVQEQSRGKLKIYIGYAPGVGKTYTMLSTANRSRKRGADIVIGYLEAHQRQDTEAQVGDLEILPRKRIEYNGTVLEELDVEAVLRRAPAEVLVDELAHTNAPGLKHEKRYQDVEELLDHGINVITTLNIQHLESLNDVVKQITGITVRETIPDRIVENADEVVVVDVSTDSLLNRLKRGNIYKSQNIEASLRNFFRKGNLSALRELTLRQTAEEVNEELVEYMDEHGISDNWQTAERVMVCIGSGNYSKKLIRRGARIARKYKCEWYVVYVDSTRLLFDNPSGQEMDRLEGHFKLGTQLGADIVKLKGKSVSAELAEFASSRHITQILIGHSNRTHLERILRGSTVNKLLKKTKNIEVHIIPHD